MALYPGEPTAPIPQRPPMTPPALIDPARSLPMTLSCENKWLASTEAKTRGFIPG